MKVKIYYENWTQADLAHGETYDHGLEDEFTFEPGDLDRLRTQYGCMAPSSSGDYLTSRDWFHTTTPVQDRDHFERGIDKYFSIHFEGITPASMRRVARVLTGDKY